MGGSLRHSSTRFTLPVKLIMCGDTHNPQVILDLGAEQNLIDPDLVKQLRLPLLSLNTPLAVRALDGKELTAVTHKTGLVKVIISGNPSETMDIFIFPLVSVSLVLGYPWLSLHNPHIHWAGGRVESWSTYCLPNCLRSAIQSSTKIVIDHSTPSTDLSSVPPEYHDVGTVFSKERALSLPPQRPYDCAIDLLSGDPPLGSRLYNLSKPQWEAMGTLGI